MSVLQCLFQFGGHLYQLFAILCNIAVNLDQLFGMSMVLGIVGRLRQTPLGLLGRRLTLFQTSLCVLLCLLQLNQLITVNIKGSMARGTLSRGVKVLQCPSGLVEHRYLVTVRNGGF